MRLTGPVAFASGLGRHDHLCWSYDGPDELRAAVVAFLSDGVTLGQRVAYAADLDEAAMRQVVSGMAGSEELLDRGALVLLPLHGVYDQRDPAAQVAVYAAATRAAVREGFTGYRIAAEATSLVLEGGRRQPFLRYEQLVDRYMATEPFAAMCAYDSGRLGADAVVELAAVHPAVHADEMPPFQLYSLDSVTAGLLGEVDGFCSDLFQRVVDDLPQEVSAIDAWALDFIDHGGLLALDAAAQRRSSLALVSARRPVQRLARLLALEHLEVTA